MYEPADLRTQAGSAGVLSEADGSDRTSGSLSQTAELLTMVERLESVVAAETSALCEHRLSDLAVYTRKKSQILLEFTRLSRMLKMPIADAQLHDRLVGLKSSLAVNRETLQVQLRAANQLTTVISDAVQAAESDGTYSATGNADRFI